MTSFRIRQHLRSLASGIVPVKDELGQIDKAATVADDYDSAGCAVQFVDVLN
jgi:hypothetical protein